MKSKNKKEHYINARFKQIAEKITGRKPYFCEKSNQYRTCMTAEQWSNYLDEVSKEKAEKKKDDAMAKLRRIYDEDDIAKILNEKKRTMKIAQGVEVIKGKKHRICVISDLHLGSKYTKPEWVLTAFATAKEVGCTCVLICGDIVDGLKNGRDASVYECTHIGYRQQKRHTIEVLRECELPMYIISGNHDAYYSGADIVEDICDNVDNATYLGFNSADLEIGGALVRMFHGFDGSSYAHSYRLQKVIESYTGGEKPQVLFCGHVHKFCYIFDRNIHAVSVPCIQRQTKFMEGKKLPAHLGFLVCDLETTPKGDVCDFSVKYYPFFC